MPKCLHAVEVCLRILDRIRRELRAGMRCNEIIATVEESLAGHESPCVACEDNLREFRQEFIPLTDTVLPGDAHESYVRIASRHGIKPTGA